VSENVCTSPNQNDGYNKECFLLNEPNRCWNGIDFKISLFVMPADEVDPVTGTNKVEEGQGQPQGQQTQSEEQGDSKLMTIDKAKIMEQKMKQVGSSI